MDKRIIIIDGNSLVNRAFYALPPLTTKEGKHTNAIYGFVTMLLKVMEDYKPDYIGVAFDKKAPTFRHKEYTDYKAGRKKMPQELAEQLEPLKEVLDAFQIYRIELEGFEADDLIGTLAKYCESEGLESLIVTGDRDALQLTSDRTKVLFTKKGISQLEIYDDVKVMEDYEVTPLQFIDLKGLMGDKSDNIPGIAGVGEKTAIKLLKQFGSIENLIQNTDQVVGEKLKEKIMNSREDAMLSKRLATIITNVPIDINLDKLKKRDGDLQKLMELFKSFEFNSLIPRIKKNIIDTNVDEVVSNSISSGGTEDIVQIIDIMGLKTLVDEVKSHGSLIIKSITEDKNIVEDKITSLAITTNGEVQYYIDFADFKETENLIQILKQLLEDKDIEIKGHDLKKEIVHFYPYGINISNITLDTMIAEYLIDAAKSSYSLKDLALEYLGEEIVDENELRGKGKSQVSLWEVPGEDLKRLLCSYVRVTANITEALKGKLNALELENLYYEVELPLVEVLGSMEFRGIKVDRNMLHELEIEFKEKIDRLTEDIYSLAETQFNINSPKQLGEVLFEKLGLPPLKKTKTGYSTNADVLEKLHDQHDIIPKISEYRQVTKLKSTYVDGLLNIINPVTNRIHSSFNQTVTTTGRISSTEPNLQNIPVRLEMGRRLRKVFISEDGHKFIDADYSQIELRVLAHIANDENLIDAFIKNQDIHRRTASEIFEVPMDEVTSTMRNDAKAVNFGIVYGISDFGLSQNLNIPVNKAKKYIESYLDKYPSIKQYMKDVVEEGKKNGYVVTLLNRRRYLPELKSSNFNIRSFGERMAMNTPIQGSAADIIKIAMVKVYRELKKGNFKSKLILQVHDELIIESPEDEVEEVAEILREAMESAINMAVPLKADLLYAYNWYDAK